MPVFSAFLKFAQPNWQNYELITFVVLLRTLRWGASMRTADATNWILVICAYIYIYRWMAWVFSRILIPRLFKAVFFVLMKSQRKSVWGRGSRSFDPCQFLKFTEDGMVLEPATFKLRCLHFLPHATQLWSNPVRLMVPFSKFYWTSG